MLAAFDVDEHRYVRREVVFVLQSRDFLAGRDPAVLLPVQADEDVALVEIGAVQRARRVGSGTELEHHRGEGQSFNCSASGPTFRRQLTQVELMNRRSRASGVRMTPAARSMSESMAACARAAQWQQFPSICLQNYPGIPAACTKGVVVRVKAHLRRPAAPRTKSSDAEPCEPSPFQSTRTPFDTYPHQPN